ncbi:Proteasome subunit beta type-7 [Blyttiomyces sp. JEL0837]|nr:Proteasome subunit beta type-7 [Blyttiomyces sp. JEL0837]
MDYFPGNWGNPRSREETLFDSSDYLPGTHAFDAGHVAAKQGPMTRTQAPVVTGTSVIALKFKGGIMMAADNLASYGSLARFRDVERFVKVGKYTIVGASGDISDFQHVKHMLETLEISEENNGDDGHTIGPKNVYEYLSRVMYNRRSKVDPLWNSLVVAGMKNGEPFLGYVDLQGTTYQSPSIATGFGGYLAQPLLRKALETHGEENITEEMAEKIINDCMRVLFYRDARSLNKLQRAVITADRVFITAPYELETNWDFAEKIRGYGA